jgi:uncharacterized BrkB/YihY/UPF0761 family membrane protein
MCVDSVGKNRAAELLLTFGVLLTLVFGVPLSLGYMFWVRFKDSEWDHQFPWALKTVADLPLASVVAGGATFLIGLAVFAAVVTSVDENARERLRRAFAWAMFALLIALVLAIAIPLTLAGINHLLN